MTLHLVRFCYSEQGTFGELRLPELRLYTVERPWQGNEPYVSCVPEGTYPLTLSHYYRGDYDTFQVRAVPGRSQIKVHRGNVATDVQGCIAVGTELGCVGGRWAVLNSSTAFEAFMETARRLLPQEIEIRQVSTQASR